MSKEKTQRLWIVQERIGKHWCFLSCARRRAVALGLRNWHNEYAEARNHARIIPVDIPTGALPGKAGKA